MRIMTTPHTANSHAVPLGRSVLRRDTFMLALAYMNARGYCRGTDDDITFSNNNVFLTPVDIVQQDDNKWLRGR